MKVSVVMITYSHEKYIEEAVRGVLNQKCSFDVELIIANDNSPDATDSIVKNILKEGHNNISINYIKRDVNLGMMPNFLDALSQAKGDFIALCDGDDYWTDPLKLQKQVDFLENNTDYSLCFHNAMVKYEENENLDRPFGNIENRDYTGYEILNKWSVPTVSVVFNKSLFKMVLHKDFIYPDIILFLSLAENGKIYAMNEIMSVYRKNETGITAPKVFSDDTLRKYIKHHIAIKNCFKYKYDPILNRILSRSYASLSMRYIAKRNLKSALFLFKSFKTDPKLFINEFLNNFKKLKSKI
ncbi:glycosyltransferase family 2 protein [Chryseobacterium wangxinyae]|uniref:glycosyltransferase family 2 protein n=1 Tax=Chryseobacterium sp. CY353 TaxID=2997334 RepID=UPI00226E72D8|nr:glycosyltransferase [Chryseobacterium sp. CY353]MCY0970993.1 glycosyltransferase [Chryseobacterium sp. CY353]